MSGFASDNFAGVHPEVLEAIGRANEGHAAAYGADDWTLRAEELFRRHFGAGTRAFPVFNGTAANVLALAAVCEPWQAVICAETAHLHVDECGAPKRLAGMKLIPVATEHGKLDLVLVELRISRLGDQHAVQPRVVSISQASELGTVYTAEEVAALAEMAHANDLLLHVDGARLANAAAQLETSLGAITADAGVDMLSFGGTKDGLLLGEAIVFCHPELADGFEFVRKQLGQLASKMRFISAQLEALLEGDLWLRNAAHANAMAARLAERMRELDQVEIVHPVESNAVFAALPEAAIGRLREALPGEQPFHVWDEERNVVRLMCSWDTVDDDVERLVGALSGALAATA